MSLFYYFLFKFIITGYNLQKHTKQLVNKWTCAEYQVHNFNDV